MEFRCSISTDSYLSKNNNKKFDVVIVLTKAGNFIMLERTTGKPIYDID